MINEIKQGKQKREKMVAEIREALEKATPRWHYNGNEIVSLDNPRVGIGGFLRDENNYLAANAPEWLGFLLDELGRKDEIIEEQKRELSYKTKEIIELLGKSWQDKQWFKQASANIIEMQKELDRERKENRKLRVKNRHLREDVVRENNKLCEQFQSAQQEIERLRQERDMYKSSSEVFYERLKKVDEERQKLIDGLLTIMDIISEDGTHWKLDRCYTTARDILKEVGVLSR